MFRESILFATLPCLNKMNQWTDRTFFYFHIFRNFLFVTLRKVLKQHESMDGWDIMVCMIFPFSRPFPQLDFSMQSGRPLTHFWHPWAPKCLTLESPWIPFGSLWAPIGSLFGPFGSLWITSGTLFDENIKTFLNFIHFLNFLGFIYIFIDFIIFLAFLSF